MTNHISGSFRVAGVGTVLSGLRMESAWMIALLAALGVRHGMAQPATLHPLPVSEACAELNGTVVAHAAKGQFLEAEKALGAALAAGADRNADTCAGLVLSNMAVILSFSGRLSEGEKLAARSVAILDKLYPPDHPVLLRPLQILATTRFDQGKHARAREAVRRMQSIRVEGAEEKAFVHAMTASLLHAGRRYSEAETEYRAALGEWERAGRGESADAGSALNMLAALYTDEGRFREAWQSLDRALAIFTHARDTAPLDRVKFLYTRGVLHARQKQWRDAEQDLHDALSMADRDLRVEPGTLQSLLTSYAQALRKNHRRQEAGAIEARGAALRGNRSAESVVDVTELLLNAKLVKR